MSNETKKTALPKLRFPEFQDAGEWEMKQLGNVADLKNGYAFKSATYVESGEFRVITISNVQEGILTVEQTRRISKLPSDIQPHQILKTGDVLMSLTGNVGRVCKVNLPSCLLNQRVGKIAAIGIDNSFLYSILQSEEFRNTMQLRAAGGAQGNLSSSSVLSYPFACPTNKKEQQKIAAALSSLDDLLTAQTAHLAALQAHKRGLMQALFPAEGETVPKLRFPEFQDAGEWEETTLGEIMQLQRGFDLPHRLRQNGSVPIISSSGNSGYHNQAVVEAPGVVTGRYGTIGEVFYIEENFWPLNTTLYVKDFKGNVPAYIAHFLKTIDFASYSEKSGVPGVNRNDLHQIIVACPTTDEQEKIVACLTSLDNRITVQSQKIEALKLHKKGLMQNLFPAAAEPTA